MLEIQYIRGGDKMKRMAKFNNTQVLNEDP